MINAELSKAKAAFCELASLCINENEVINISTKEGNVIMIREDNYNSLVESLYLAGMYKSLKDINNTPTREFKKEAPWN